MYDEGGKQSKDVGEGHGEKHVGRAMSLVVLPVPENIKQDKKTLCADPGVGGGPYPQPPGKALSYRWRRKTGLSPLVKYFTDHSKAVLLLWIFYVFSVLCLLCLCARLFICALWSPAGNGLTSWLSFLVYNCEFVIFPMVSGVRLVLDCIDS